MSQHKHYKLLKQYAKDAKKTDSPWELYANDHAISRAVPDSELTFMSNLGSMYRLDNADELLTPVSLIPVDMNALCNVGVICRFTGAGGYQLDGFLRGIDHTKNFPYYNGESHWENCHPIEYWYSANNFPNVDETIEIIQRAGFMVQIEFNDEGSDTSLFKIISPLETHCMPWEVSK